MTEDRSALANIMTIVVTMAGMMFVIMAIPYVGIAVLFAFQAFNPNLLVEVGGVVMPFGLGYGAMSLFLVLSAVSASAGLAAIFRWHGWRPLVSIAACATLGIVVFAAWLRLSGGLVGLPWITLAIAIAVAIFGLLAVLGMRR